MRLVAECNFGATWGREAREQTRILHFADIVAELWKCRKVIDRDK